MQARADICVLNSYQLDLNNPTFLKRFVARDKNMIPKGMNKRCVVYLLGLETTLHDEIRIGVLGCRACGPATWGFRIILLFFPVPPFFSNTVIFQALAARSKGGREEGKGTCLLACLLASQLASKQAIQPARTHAGTQARKERRKEARERREGRSKQK